MGTILYPQLNWLNKPDNFTLFCKSGKFELKWTTIIDNVFMRI